MTNRTGWPLRLRNRSIYRRIRFFSKIWIAHQRKVIPKHSGSNGILALLLVSESGIPKEPNPRLSLVALGASSVDALLAHAIQSFEGATRLLTFQGGNPLPWSAMVLARTALEASLKIDYLLEIPFDRDEKLARFAALAFEDLNEHKLRHRDLGGGFQAEALAANAERKMELESLLDSVGMTVEWGLRGSGNVVTSKGRKAPFPLKTTTLANDFDQQLGLFYYRWLCTFTHASPFTPQKPGTMVAAVREEDLLAVFALITRVLKRALDAYGIWAGIPAGLARWALGRVSGILARRGSTLNLRNIKAAEPSALGNRADDNVPNINLD